MTAFESIISEMAAATGLPLEIDEKDACSVEADGIITTIQYRRDKDDVTIFSLVEEEADEAKCRAALKLSLHGKGTDGNFIGLFDGGIVMSTFMPLEGLTAETLGARLLSFADTALQVRSAIEAEEGKPAQEVDASVEGSSFDFSNFSAIRV